MDIVLVYPEIPHNSGSVGRLSAALGVDMHLVKPLGFSLEDRYLKRAGLDYWPLVSLRVHEDWSSALRFLEAGSDRPVGDRLRCFSARGGTSLFQIAFQQDDILVYGCESKGLPSEVLKIPGSSRVYLPIRPGVRSLNLASTVAVSLYTAMQSSGIPLPDNDGTYIPVPDGEKGRTPSQIVRDETGQA